tara:strand:+ start:103 stop:327 length:225 start_codon:yes stop_codon:yes gene_type:complete
MDATKTIKKRGRIMTNNLMLQGLQQLFDELANTTNHDKQDKLIENEACKHKESIRELCEENAELKRKLKEYENE